MKQPDFEKGNGLIVAIVQHAETLQVLMQGFMDKAAYDKTIKDGKVTFFSRTKNRLWTKGEESGHFLNVQSLELDCDNDSVLIKALPDGPTCHEGTVTCWGDGASTSFEVIARLEKTIAERWKNGDKAHSYVAHLRDKGTAKIAQKVGEEAVELVIEAMKNDEELFLNESADLLFHFLILLHARGYKLENVLSTLAIREK
jgi:phosphoribosyl-AMP cyclohydrolase / phosphoribosyl-ATP pyrophosphohydrolase